MGRRRRILNERQRGISRVRRGEWRFVFLLLWIHLQLNKLHEKREVAGKEARRLEVISRQTCVALAACLCLACCSPFLANAEVVGRLILDQDSIFRSMPVSGYVQLESDQDIELDGSLDDVLGMAFDGCMICVTGPDGAELVIDRSVLWSGASINRGRSPAKDVIVAGRQLVVPVYLLKTRDRFLFDVVGKYRIAFIFTALPNRVECTADVMVADCDPCGREQFESMIWPSHILVRPFDASGIMPNAGAVSEQDVYYQAVAVTQAHQIGGSLVARTFLAQDSATAARLQASKDVEIDSVVSEGVRWEAKLPKSRGMWALIRDRVATIKQKVLEGDWRQTDEFGRVLVLPR